MQQNTSNTNIRDIKTGLEQLLPTTKETLPDTADQPTWLKSSNATSEEQPPSAFTKIGDISIKGLKISALPSGFRTLDQHYVLKKNRPELVVVGAGTSHGKSAFMVQIAANVARTGPVFVFSLEMDERDIKSRLLSPMARVPLRDIQSGDGDEEKLVKAEQKLQGLPLYICTNGRRDIHYITQTCYEGVKLYGQPQMVIIDYLQLLRGPVKPSRTAEIAEILGIIKELAKGLKCPIIMGSQLNRECERRGKLIEQQKGVGDYKPIKSDLMDSGSIEHDADVIMFISRQHVYDRQRPGEADFIIAKNRNGKLYDGVFDFQGDFCAFSDPEDRYDI